jgi:beta-lactamase regulating signal transducer with metallopeptidase domain
MVSAEHWQSVAELVVGGMLNGVIEGLLIALCGWVLLRTMRRQNSNTRFAVWLATFVAVAVLPFVGRAHSVSGAESASRFEFLLPGPWAKDIFFMWALIAAAGLAKLAVGFWQLHKLRRSCVPLNLPELNHSLCTLNANGFHRRIQICLSEKARVPAAIGFIKPIIVIPAWALNELTPGELNTVVLHELAHLRRWDDWTNLAQKFVGALLFFHPAVWWIDRGLVREREMACDDFVLSATEDHREYAKCLVSVAEKSLMRRGFALAQAMAERMHLTAQRVARILQGARSAEQPATTNVWKPAVAVMTVVSAVCLFSLAREPMLVAFDDGNSEPVAIAETAPHFEAKVIPASFIARDSNSSAHDRTFAKSGVFRHVAKQRPEKPPTSVIAANAQPLIRTLPQMTNAKAQDSVRATAPHTVLVIMQDNEVDAYGRIWSVSVWQLTIYRPDQNIVRQSQKGVPPKST